MEVTRVALKTRNLTFEGPCGFVFEPWVRHRAWVIDGQHTRLGTPPRGKRCIGLEWLPQATQCDMVRGHKPQIWEFLG